MSCGAVDEITGAVCVRTEAHVVHRSDENGFEITWEEPKKLILPDNTETT